MRRKAVRNCQEYTDLTTLTEQFLAMEAGWWLVACRPVLLINHGDNALEIDRVVEPGCGLGENVRQQTPGFTEFPQDVCVMVSQSRAGEVFQNDPSAVLGHLGISFIGQLQEQQLRELFNVVAVIDAIMTKGMAKAPEFLDDITHVCFRTGGRD